MPLQKGFSGQCGAAVQLSSAKWGEGKRNSHVLFPGGVGELVTTLEDVCRKCLKLWVWSILGNGVTFFWLLIMGAQIKNRRVGGPRTGLKMGKKQLVLLHLRTSLWEGSQCLWPALGYMELFLINNMEKIDEPSLKYLLLAAFKDSSFSCCLF